MAKPRKPGNPWNQFAKKPAGKPLAKRTPKPEVRPSRAIEGGKEAKALPAAKNGKPTASSPSKAEPGVQRVKVRDLGTTPAKQVTGNGQKALPAGKKGGAMTRTSAARKAGRGLAEAALGIEAGKALGNAIGGAYRKAIGKEKAEQFGREGGYGRYTPRGSQEGGGMGGVGNIPPGEGRQNNPNYGKSGAKPSVSRPAVSSPSSQPASRSTTTSASPTKAAGPSQSKNMDENYAVWAKENRSLAEKVKAGQAGFDAIQKALGKTDQQANNSLKIDSGSQQPSAAKSKPSAVEDSINKSAQEKGADKAFNPESLNKLSKQETADERRRRMLKEAKRSASIG